MRMVVYCGLYTDSHINPCRRVKPQTGQSCPIVCLSFHSHAKSLFMRVRSRIPPPRQQQRNLPHPTAASSSPLQHRTPSWKPDSPLEERHELVLRLWRNVRKAIKFTNWRSKQKSRPLLKTVSKLSSQPPVRGQQQTLVLFVWPQNYRIILGWAFYAA